MKTILRHMIIVTTFPIFVTAGILYGIKVSELGKLLYSKDEEGYWAVSNKLDSSWYGRYLDFLIPINIDSLPSSMQ